MKIKCNLFYRLSQKALSSIVKDSKRTKKQTTTAYVYEKWFCDTSPEMGELASERRE